MSFLWIKFVDSFDTASVRGIRGRWRSVFGLRPFTYREWMMEKNAETPRFTPRARVFRLGRFAVAVGRWRTILTAEEALARSSGFVHTLPLDSRFHGEVS